MVKGSTVCIHAAMKEFYNYQGTTEELIHKVMDVITSEGTLMMPAYPSAEKFKMQILCSMWKMNRLRQDI